MHRWRACMHQKLLWLAGVSGKHLEVTSPRFRFRFVDSADWDLAWRPLTSIAFIKHDNRTWKQ